MIRAIGYAAGFVAMAAVVAVLALVVLAAHGIARLAGHRPSPPAPAAPPPGWRQPDADLAIWLLGGDHRQAI
jgi:hypothetical protein